jgi:hypothetical protein
MAAQDCDMCNQYPMRSGGRKLDSKWAVLRAVHVLIGSSIQRLVPFDPFKQRAKGWPGSVAENESFVQTKTNTD